MIKNYTTYIVSRIFSDNIYKYNESYNKDLYFGTLEMIISAALQDNDFITLNR